MWLRKTTIILNPYHSQRMSASQVSVSRDIPYVSSVPWSIGSFNEYNNSNFKADSLILFNLLKQTDTVTLSHVGHKQSCNSSWNIMWKKDIKTFIQKQDLFTEKADKTLHKIPQ